MGPRPAEVRAIASSDQGEAELRDHVLAVVASGPAEDRVELAGRLNWAIEQIEANPLNALVGSDTVKTLRRLREFMS